MKIQCDACEKEEASVFCPADEAALCHGCDRNIHHANKLAVKHTRLPLHHPATSEESPLCDICQERRAFLFCKEDRAILCRECDLPIHRLNEHTQNHNRFLLTGVKISSSSSSNGRNTANNAINRPHRSVSNENFSTPSVGNSPLASYTWNVEDNLVNDTGSVSTSSISEYYTETIPSFCFEELLDASFATDGFCMFCYTDKENYGHQWEIQNQYLEANICLFPSEEVWGSWMPQVEAQFPQLSTLNLPQLTKANEANAAEGNLKCRDNCQNVPRNSAQSTKICRRCR